MTTAETLRARIAEAEACIAACAENVFARQVLSARRAALADALALLDPSGPVVTLTDEDRAALKDEPLVVGDPRPITRPDQPEIPPAAASPAVRDRVAPSDPPADRGTLADDEPSPVYTRARVALLRELWPDTTLPLPEIMARLNELPGIPIASYPAMQQHAKKLGLAGIRRHKRPSPAEAETPPLPTSAPAPPPPAPNPTPPPMAPAPPIGAQHDKARALLRDGYAASTVAIRIGLHIDEVHQIIAEGEREARRMLRAGNSSEDIIAATGVTPRRIRELRDEARPAA